MSMLARNYHSNTHATCARRPAARPQAANHGSAPHRVSTNDQLSGPDSTSNGPRTPSAPFGANMFLPFACHASVCVWRSRSHRAVHGRGRNNRGKPRRRRTSAKQMIGDCGSVARCGVVFSLVFLPCPDLANSCVESVVPFRLPPPRLILWRLLLPAACPTQPMFASKRPRPTECGD